MKIGLRWMAILSCQMCAPLALAAVIDLASHPGLEDVSDLPGVKLDIRYATSDNFLGKPVYGDFKRCYLQKIAAEKLKAAARLLEARKPGWRLLVFDCLRPHSIQEQMWQLVKGTPRQKYVADPATGSMHNFGFAVDLSLVDAGGREVDMGTPFDYFGPEAEPRQEDRILAQGRLTQTQVDDRRFLRQLMSDSGFTPLAIEWWHFDALDKSAVKSQYKMVE